MPNWARGVLRIRGKRQNIRLFLIEGLKPLSKESALITGERIEQPKTEIKENEWGCTIESPNGFLINGTRRAFIEGQIEWSYKDCGQKESLSIDSFKQAWEVDAESFAELSKQYDVDFEIHTIESRMLYQQNIEIQSGSILKNEGFTLGDSE